MTFNSEENEHNLSFLFWDEQGVVVLDTGREVYLVDDNLNLVISFDISICLIVFYLINEDRLLVLEEASFKLVTSKGQLLMEESLDLIEDFSFKDNILFIQTSQESRTLQLT